MARRGGDNSTSICHCAINECSRIVTERLLGRRQHQWQAFLFSVCASIIDWLQHSLRHILLPLNASGEWCSNNTVWESKKDEQSVTLLYFWWGKTTFHLFIYSSSCLILVLWIVFQVQQRGLFNNTVVVALNPRWRELKCIHRRKHCTGNGDDGAVYCAGYRHNEKLQTPAMFHHVTVTNWICSMEGTGWMRRRAQERRQRANL